MRLQPEVYKARRAFLFEQLTADPKASYVSLQRALKEKFGHAMQQRILRKIRTDWQKERRGIAPVEPEEAVALAAVKPQNVMVYRTVPAGSDNYVLDEELTKSVNIEPQAFTREVLESAVARIEREGLLPEGTKAQEKEIAAAVRAYDDVADEPMDFEF